MSRQFDVGDVVMAKWPKSSLYFDAVVKDFNESDYLVQFNDEEKSEYAVKYSYVKSKDSMLRRRSPSRSRKSPSRGRKSRSPARRTKSANRSSPTRKTSKSPARATTQSPKNKIEKTLTNNHVTPVRLTRAKVRETLGENNVTLEYSAALEDARKFLDLQTINPTAPASPSWLAWLAHSGVAVLVLAGLLCLPLLLQQACVKSRCSITTLPPLASDPWKYYSPLALAVTCSLAAATLLLNLLPVRVATLPDGSTHRANGVVTLAVVVLAVSGLQYAAVLRLRALYTLLRPLLALHTVLGLCAGVALYVKSVYCSVASLNPRLTSVGPSDMIEGRDTAPVLGPYNVKCVLYQYSAICSLLLTAVLYDRAYGMALPADNVPFGVICAMQAVWCLDMLVFEPTFTSGGDYRSRGCGVAFTVGSLVMPFISLLYPRQVYNHGSELEVPHVVATSLLFLAGYLVYRLAANERHALVTSPHNPAIAKLESMPTAAGRLAMAGWFGTVRHPVAAGALVMLSAISLTAGMRQPLVPLLWAAAVAAVLRQVWRSEAHAAARDF